MKFPLQPSSPNPIDFELLQIHRSIRAPIHPTPNRSGGLWMARLLVFMHLGTLCLAGAILPGNFWPNPSFELGADLNNVNGSVANWNRGGNDAKICQIVTNNFSSPTHALALIDANEGDFYGEWYSDVLLGSNAGAGDTLQLQWSEMYNLSGPEMRLTVLFFDAAGGVVGEHHFVTVGTSNAGWAGSIETSAFNRRTGFVQVPPGSVKMRCSLVSGGSGGITGLFLMDDLSVARIPGTASDNLVLNSNFELGDMLDTPKDAAPAGLWTRGGSDASIDQVSMVNAVSPSHSLALVDTNEDGYGEWYGFLALPGVVAADVLDLRWFQLYETANGPMRLSVAFTDAENNPVPLGSFNFLADGHSPGWQGSLATSPFEPRSERLLVPDGAVKLRVNFASGGSSLVTGTMLIDNLTLKPAKPNITAFSLDGNGFSVTWNSISGKTYAVQFANSLGTWSALKTGLASSGLTTSYLDAALHTGSTGFYRILQE